MNSPFALNKAQALEIVRTSVSSKISPLPQDDIDLVETGALDSMGWVDTLIGIESATGIRDFGNPWPENRRQSIRVLAEMVLEARELPSEEEAGADIRLETRAAGKISISGWGYSLGSRTLSAEQVERELVLPAHRIRDGAGIDSVCLAADAEDELVLGQRAAEIALDLADAQNETIDFLVTTSATFLGFPSFAASLHSRLLLREACGALDIGGACAGLIYALAVAKSLLSIRRGGVALVVASEVNSRRLTAPNVPGEFRGLFGDGSCAFVLTDDEGIGCSSKPSLGDFVWGCSGTYAASLGIKTSEHGGLEVQFKGEQLAHAAVTQLDRIIGKLEKLSNKSRGEVDCFALHQPNPRVVQILAETAKIDPGRIPPVAKTSGNLGSVTCGVSLCQALAALSRSEDPSRTPLIFMAAVAPGMIWVGTYWN